MGREKKVRITITVPSDVVDYVERLVTGGKAASVDAVFNDAVAAERVAGQRALTLLRERARGADPDRVARMTRHVNRQLAEQGFPAAYGRIP